MSDVKIGVQTRSLRQPLRAALRTAAELGAEGVELDLRNELPSGEFSRTAVREFRKLLDDLRLKFAAGVFPTRRDFGDADGLERRVAAVLQVMPVVRELGAGLLVVRPGRIDAADAPRHQRMVESLTALAVQGERVRAQLLLHSGDAPPATLAELLTQLPEGLVGVALHPGELLRAGHDPQAALEELGPHVRYLYAADAVHDLGSRRVVEVELGRGVTELPELLGSLEEFGFRGWTTIERLSGSNPVEDVGNAVAFLQAL